MKPFTKSCFAFCSLLIFAALPSARAVSPSLPSTSNHVRSPAPTLTPEEWQELRTARAAALKAKPQLVKKNAEIATELREFQQKLDAAMLKTDPSLLPYLASYSPRFHPATLSGNPSLGHPANSSATSVEK
jgi:hypothetical protein